MIAHVYRDGKKKAQQWTPAQKNPRSKRRRTFGCIKIKGRCIVFIYHQQLFNGRNRLRVELLHALRELLLIKPSSLRRCSYLAAHGTLAANLTLTKRGERELESRCESSEKTWWGKRMVSSLSVARRGHFLRQGAKLRSLLCAIRPDSRCRESSGIATAQPASRSRAHLFDAGELGHELLTIQEEEAGEESARVSE